MIKEKQKEDISLYLIVAAIGVLVFCGLYGIKVLNPQYTDWLLVGGDLSQHYIGWQAYRIGAWQFPIGLTDMLFYPNKTSIIFTDSIPLFAVFFKILSPILTEEFQYFGIWGVMSFALQGIFACRILKKFTANKLPILVGSTFFIIAPTVIQRMYEHTALAGQWILLIALDMVFSYETYANNKKKTVTALIIIGLLAAAIHIYFVMMCGIIILSFCIEDWLYQKKLRDEIRNILIYCGAAGGMVAILGGFTSTGSTAAEGGLGIYSMNLNALFNPQGWSTLLKDQALLDTGGQAEGFAYLGVGMICLTIAAIVCMLTCNVSKNINHKKKIGAICIMMILSTIFALSPIISFNGTPILEIPLPEIIRKLWSVFRATGRVAWVIDYTIMIIVVGYLISHINYKKILWILIPCAVLQVCDLSNVLVQKHDRFSKVACYESPLTDEIWDAVGLNTEIMHIEPTAYLGEKEFYDLGEWAIKSGKTMGAFAIAHLDSEVIAERAAEKLKKPRADEVYVFENFDRLLLNKYGLHYYEANDYIIGSVNTLANFTEIDSKMLKKADWKYENNMYLINGEDRADGRYISADGISYGPYWSVPAGRWKITIVGDDIADKTDISVYSNQGTQHYQYDLMAYNDRLELFISLNEDVQDLEIAIKNISNEEVRLNRLSIQGE